jgi:ABC-type antimicrobial peptide transport system permease subunit
MFFTYLWRELRRRMRQAIFISLGLALGIGLVITVTAASNGVKNSQAGVLHALYGVGTDLTVTQPPAQGSGGQKTQFAFQQQLKAAKQGQVAAGTKININDLVNGRYAPVSSGALATVARQHDVTSAIGGLILSDVTVTGTVPAVTAGGKGGGGSFKSAFTTNSFGVVGVDPAHTSLGSLSAARLTSGRALTAADANSDHAVVDSGYATQNRLAVGSVIDVGGTNFTITGIVSAAQGGSPPDVYIPLARAQSLGKNGTGSSLAGQVNTIYVSAASAADISLVQQEISRALPTVTVTDQNDLASEVTGSLSSASTLASNLGKWLSVAVLAAAFLLASLLTMAAVTRRVREFGTLKALGWRSRRIVGQVMGESIATGIIGGAVGVGFGFAGAALIDKLAPKLSATVGSSNAASVAGTGKKGAGGALSSLTDAAHTVSVTLNAPVTVTVILLAVLLAVAGGLIAGSFGGWRAARLRPAAALARVE